jgi:peptidylprolyl isomerase
LSLSASTHLRVRAVVAIAGVLLLTLTACSSGSSPSAKSSSPAAATGVFPTVSNGYGNKPTLTFPKTKPSTSLQTKVLSTGDGDVVAKNDLLVVDYLGQIWNGKVFDNSFDRKTPYGTPIGAGMVIKGWDDALVGKKVGSRVLIVVPPASGYGTSGNTDAGIKGTDTLAFVIDIVAVYSKADVGDKKAVVQKVNTAPVTVTGALGAKPTVKVAKGAKLPTVARVLTLAKGSGKKVTAGLLVVQYEAVFWDNTLADSTVERGQPQATTVGAAATGNPFNGAIGIPLGSRILITTPSQSADGKTATGLAIVADLIAVEQPAKA